MLNSFWVAVALGILLGFLAGLGIGGGSLLLLWLTLVLGMDPGTARAINLLFFLPAAVAACCFRWRQGSLAWKRTLPAIAAGCTGAFLGTWLGTALDTQLLKKGFGLLLIATGIREAAYGVKRRK